MNFFFDFYFLRFYYLFEFWILVKGLYRDSNGHTHIPSSYSSLKLSSTEFDDDGVCRALERRWCARMMWSRERDNNRGDFQATNGTSSAKNKWEDHNEAVKCQVQLYNFKYFTFGLSLKNLDNFLILMKYFFYLEMIYFFCIF